MDLSCSDDNDCRSYQDKQIKSECINKLCKCTIIKLNNVTECSPRVIEGIDWNLKIITLFHWNFQLEIKSNKVGEQCPCNIFNSHCEFPSNKCQCVNGFVETPDKLRCIKIVVPLNQPCEMNEQCVKYDMNAVCQNSTCRCLKNFANHDNNCRALVKVGEKCESNLQCEKTTTNVTCMNHECLCDKSFVASKDGNVSQWWNTISNFLINFNSSTACRIETSTRPVKKTPNAKMVSDRDQCAITACASATPSIANWMMMEKQFVEDLSSMAMAVRNTRTAQTSSMNRQCTVSKIIASVARATNFTMLTCASVWRFQRRSQLVIITEVLAFWCC